jgi:acid phosphatase
MLQRQYEALSLSRLKMPPLRQLTVVAAVACTFALFLVIWSYSSTDRHVAEPLNPTPLKPFVPPYGISPLSPSWKQWFSPQGWSEGRVEASKGGKVDENWNIYYHLGGNGPWIPKLDGIVTNDTAPPEGCTVTQVHMVL